MNKGKIKQIIASSGTTFGSNPLKTENFQKFITPIGNRVSGYKKGDIARFKPYRGLKSPSPVRAISSTDGLIRGQEVSNKQETISVQETQKNFVLGTIDEGPAITVVIK